MAEPKCPVVRGVGPSHVMKFLFLTGLPSPLDGEAQGEVGEGEIERAIAIEKPSVGERAMIREKTIVGERAKNIKTID